MRTGHQAPYPFQQLPVNDTAASAALATLVLLFLIFAAVLLASTAIKDPIVASLDDFAHFRVWGAENKIENGTGNDPGVSITTPAEDDIYYNDEKVGISGNAIPDEGRKTSMVFYRVNEGEWVKASLEGNTWAGMADKYPEGEYLIEAIAYDNEGGESAPDAVNFTTLFRYVPNARYVRDDIPAVMATGEVYHCTITYENSGNVLWDNAGEYRLSPYSTTALGSGSSAVPVTGVQPGDSYSFDVTLTAPATPGSYVVSYRMQGGGYGWFGDEARKTVTVAEPVYDASVVSVDMPSQMTAGQTYNAAIVMRNSGTATWYADGDSSVRLNTVGGGFFGDASLFTGATSFPMSAGTIVRHDGTYEFRFNIIAPWPGQFYLEFLMSRTGASDFGAIASKSIHVVPAVTPTPAPTPAPTIAPTSPPYVAYNAYGKFRMIGKDGSQETGYIFLWCYDGPLCLHNQRSSYLNEPWWPYPDWDIGGPNGHYTVYSDYYRGSGSFDMNYGGPRGTITFYIN